MASPSSRFNCEVPALDEVHVDGCDGARGGRLEILSAEPDLPTVAAVDTKRQPASLECLDAFGILQHAWRIVRVGRRGHRRRQRHLSASSGRLLRDILNRRNGRTRGARGNTQDEEHGNADCREREEHLPLQRHYVARRTSDLCRLVKHARPDGWNSPVGMAQQLLRGDNDVAAGGPRDLDRAGSGCRKPAFAHARDPQRSHNRDASNRNQRAERQGCAAPPQQHVRQCGRWHDCGEHAKNVRRTQARRDGRQAAYDIRCAIAILTRHASPPSCQRSPFDREAIVRRRA